MIFRLVPFSTTRPKTYILYLYRLFIHAMQARLENTQRIYKETREECSPFPHVLYVPIAQSLFTFHRLKIECEKLASEKTEMQRHYVMVRHFVSSFSRLFIFSQHAHPCLLKDRLPRVAFQLSIILLRTRHVI